MTDPACHAALRRFWFPLSRGLGIGVTAPSEEEARAMAEAVRAQYHASDQIVDVVRDVAVDSLDSRHVLPNAGPVVVRGVWFPRLNI